MTERANSRHLKKGQRPPGSAGGRGPSSLVYGAYCQKPLHKRAERRAISGPNVLRITTARRDDEKEALEAAHVREWRKWLDDPPPDAETPLPGGKRGSVRGLSQQSAARLMELLASLLLPGNIVHSTLTFGKDFPETTQAVKAVFKRLQAWADYRGYYGVWALHFQKRGAAHWHVLWFNLDEGGQADLRNYWARFNPSPHGVHFTEGNTAKGAFYLGLHHAKGKDQTCWPKWYKGRAWGYFGRDLVLNHQYLEEVGTQFSPLEWVCLKRLYKRFMQSKGYRGKLAAYCSGFRLYLPQRHHGAILHCAANWARALAADRGPRWVEMESEYFPESDPF
jgi:hypothetical protein